MNTQQQHISFLVRITTLFSMVVMLLFFASCRQNRDFVGLEFDPELVPSMITTQVNTLISDSGITRIRMTADMWKVFDRAAEPHWFFPEGLYVEQFDSLFNIEATIQADTAWNFTAQELWRLTGDVHGKNVVTGFQFWSEELYWDQTEGVFFSNKLTRTKEADGFETFGTGFRVDQAMRYPRFFEPHDGRIPFVDNMPARRFNEEEEWRDEETDEEEEEVVY